MSKRQPDPNDDRFHEREEREKRHRAQLPGEDDEPLPPPTEPIRSDAEQPKRNDPCSCGSGKKYKQCCGKPNA